MKGIILAGGNGTRLRPNTISVSKQLLPIYDKPLIYYPLATLMLAGIREILIITTPKHKQLFADLLGNGESLGMTIKFQIQDKPEGIAQAFVIGKDFIQNDNVCLILGDNIFYGNGVGTNLVKLTDLEGAQIFGYEVKDPENYGVVECNEQGEIISIEEKPKIPKSKFAIPGIYFFDNSVTSKVNLITKSARGEFEITSLLNLYLEEKSLKITILPRGTAWMDCGTIQSMNEASNYIRALEERQGSKIAAIEEIAWRNKWIHDQQLLKKSKELSGTDYSSYLESKVNKL